MWLKQCYNDINELRHWTTPLLDPEAKRIRLAQKFQARKGRPPTDVEIRGWISRLVSKIMDRLCPLPPSAPKWNTVVWIPDTLELDPTAEANKIMSDMYAIKFTTAPMASGQSEIAEVLGENSLHQWKLDRHSFQTNEIQIDSLKAYVTANMSSNGPSEQLLIEPYPELGADHPRVIDVSLGNPKWPNEEELGHIRSDEEAWGTSLVRPDSWVDVDFDGFVLAEDAFRQSQGDCSRCPIISYREVAYVQAAVYVSCEEDKHVKSPRCFPAPSQVVILDKDNFIFGFTDTLHHRQFSLESIPDGSKPTPLFADDELRRWLGQFCAEGSVKDPPPGFELCLGKMSWPIVDKRARFDFEITMPFPGRHMRKLSTNIGAEQTFAKSTTDTSGSETAVSFKALTNMFISRRILVFGLESSNAPINTTFDVTAKFFRVEVGKLPLFQILTGDLGLILDPIKDFHNAIWFRPGMEHQTHLRLQFHLDSAFEKKFDGWLRAFSKDLNVESLLMVMRKKARWMWSVPTDRMEFQGSATFLCTFRLSETVQLQGEFKMKESQMLLSLTLQRPKQKATLQVLRGKDGAMDTVIQWISSKFNVTNTDSLSSLLKTATDDDSSALKNDSILPRRVELVLDLNANGSIKGVNAGSIDIEACDIVGRSTVAAMEQSPTLFLLSFGWTRISGFYFKGKLWPIIPDSPFAEYGQALPEAEEYQNLEPATLVDPQKQLRTLDLARLLSSDPNKGISIPAGLPSEIHACETTLSQ